MTKIEICARTNKKKKENVSDEDGERVCEREKWNDDFYLFGNYQRFLKPMISILYTHAYTHVSAHLHVNAYTKCRFIIKKGRDGYLTIKQDALLHLQRKKKEKRTLTDEEWGWGELGRAQVKNIYTI